MWKTLIVGKEGRLTLEQGWLVVTQVEETGASGGVSSRHGRHREAVCRHVSAAGGSACGGKLS